MQIVATLLFTFGFLYDKRKGKHCIIMGAAAIANAVFVVSYMMARLLREEVPSPPPRFEDLYRAVVIPHGILSLIVLVLAIVLVFLAYKWRKKNDVVALGRRRPLHRRMGLATLTLWYISLLTGIIVYVILYVL